MHYAPAHINVKKTSIRLAALTVASVFVTSITVPSLASAMPRQNKYQKAMSRVGGVLESSDNVRLKRSSTVVAQTENVSIPKDARRGVTFGSFRVGLPGARQNKAGKLVASGVVGYDTTANFSNAVQATEDGGLRMLTILDNPSAPTRFDYPVSLPQGGTIRVMSDGSAVVTNAHQEPIITVATPWAKDARGKSIRTHFTTNGQTLTQHVNHRVPGVAYPIVADPKFKISWTRMSIYFNRSETAHLSHISQGAVMIYLGAKAGINSSMLAMAAMYAADQAMKKRGYCIVVFKYHYSPLLSAGVYKC